MKLAPKSTRLALAGVVALLLAGAPAARAADAAKTQVACFTLSDALTERPPGFSLSSLIATSTARPAALSQLLVALNKAAKDPAISGVYLDLQSFSLSLSQA